MIGRLNHVAIVVPDLEAAVAVYRDMLGAKVSETEDQPEHGVTTVFIELPNTKVETRSALIGGLVGAARKTEPIPFSARTFPSGPASSTGRSVAIRPSTPAFAARSANRSSPIRSIGFM